jgi:hypothetical protein
MCKTSIDLNKHIKLNPFLSFFFHFSVVYMARISNFLINLKQKKEKKEIEKQSLRRAKK